MSRKRPDLVPLAILLGLALFATACWYGAPVVIHELKHQDCIASGRTDC